MKRELMVRKSKVGWSKRPVQRAAGDPVWGIIRVSDFGRRISLGFVLAVLGLQLPAVAAGIVDSRAPLVTAPMHVGFTRSSFTNVNPADAEAAFRVFAQTVGRRRGYALDTSTRVFDTTATCEAEIKRGGLTMVILDALDYLSVDIPQMEPAFVHRVHGSTLKEQMLLVRQGSGPQGLGDLRGKDIVVLSSRSGSVAMIWLETLLLEAGLGAPAGFFGRLELAARASAAVLPVFFGTKAACVVDRLSFRTMVELNPQVGRLLAPLAVSEPMLDSITCITRLGYADPRHREDFIAGLRDLHLEPAGRQILTMFKVDQLVPFQEEHLSTVKKMHARHAHLVSAATATAPASRSALIPIQPVSKE